MLIDWFTISAQVVNFIILVWLMKRFLYKPVLKAIDAREERIAAELADADATRAEAQRERAEFQQKNEQFDQERAALFGQVSEEAKAERQRLLGEAREAADEMTAKRLETLRSEAQDLSHTIGRRTRDEVFAVSRMALKDLAGASLEERMSEAFTQRLRALDSQGRAQLEAALRTASEPAVVRSAFELPMEQRADIKRALKEVFSADIALRFETAPGLIGGIELSTNGQKVAWSIDDYLGSLEKSVGELLEKPGAAQGEIEAKAEGAMKGGADAHTP